ncbi:MAG: nitrilotriacetate monooxygenase [Chelatococcus sp.]|nr:MAG: nitrilotriacetate monooxygenase [Chelatococcus sp.]
MTSIEPLILGVTLDVGSRALGAAAEWRERWTRLITALDGVAEFAVLADGFAHPDGDGPDAALLANWLAPRAPRIGLIAGAALNLVEPFHVSTAIATLDHVSEGRAGLLAQRLPAAHNAAAFRAIGKLNGFPDAGDGAALDRDLADAVDAIRRLWDSWEDDAVIRDTRTQRYLDGGKLHYVDFAGAAFKVLGPSITPRPPQGQPVVAARWAPGEGDALAAEADLAILDAAHIAAFKARPGGGQALIVAELGESDPLFAALRGAAEAGARAVSIVLSGAPEEAEAFAARTAPALRAAGLVRPAAEGALRRRFGLPATPNRYSSAA